MESKHRFPQPLEIASRFPHSLSTTDAICLRTPLKPALTVALSLIQQGLIIYDLVLAPEFDQNGAVEPKTVTYVLGLICYTSLRLFRLPKPPTGGSTPLSRSMFAPRAPGSTYIQTIRLQHFSDPKKPIGNDDFTELHYDSGVSISAIDLLTNMSPFRFVVAALVAMSMTGQPGKGPEHVAFASGKLQLSGQLWRPMGHGRFPAVLFNHGSGKEALRS